MQFRRRRCLGRWQLRLRPYHGAHTSRLPHNHRWRWPDDGSRSSRTHPQRGLNVRWQEWWCRICATNYFRFNAVYTRTLLLQPKLILNCYSVLLTGDHTGGYSAGWKFLLLNDWGLLLGCLRLLWRADWWGYCEWTTSYHLWWEIGVVNGATKRTALPKMVLVFFFWFCFVWNWAEALTKVNSTTLFNWGWWPVC